MGCEPPQQPHVVLAELVIHWIHHGADSSGRSRRRTPGRPVSSVDEGDGFTKTLASITLSVSGVAMEIATEEGNSRVESVGG